MPKLIGLFRDLFIRSGVFTFASVNGRMCNFTYVSNKDINYFTYNASSDSPMTRVVVNILGLTRSLTWLVRGCGWILYSSQPTEVV